MCSNKVPTSKFLSSIEAICYWLGYQYKIGREQLIHEASLRYPIADTLTSHSIKIDQIILEKLHPLFESKKIDLVILKDGADDDDSITDVYEFKLAKSSTAKKEGEEHQRVFDDVVRLAYFNLWEKKDCYFLMCGKFEDFRAFFVGQTKAEVKESKKDKKNIVNARKMDSVAINWCPDGIYKDWFEFEVNKTIQKQFDNTNEKFGLKKFQDNYKIRRKKGRNYKNQITVQTTCMAITPFGGLNRTHAAGIWKIEGVSQ